MPFSTLISSPQVSGQSSAQTLCRTSGRMLHSMLPLPVPRTRKPFALRLKGVVSSVQERIEGAFMRIITVLAFIGLPALHSGPACAGHQSEQGDDRAFQCLPVREHPLPGRDLQQVPAPHLNNHAGRLGGVVSGSIPYTGVPPGQRGRFPGRTVVVPYAYPVFYGSGYGYRLRVYYGQEPQAPNVTVVVPQQPVPQVIINNSYVPDTAKACSARILAWRTAGIQCEGIRRSFQAAHRERLRIRAAPSWTRSRPSIWSR